MTSRSALRALAGGLGIAAGLVGATAIVAAVLVALGLPADSRADDPAAAVVAQPRPTELVVELNLDDPVLQAGVVRNGQVILARGLEVEIARALARHLGIPRVSFVYAGSGPQRPLAVGAPAWQIRFRSPRRPSPDSSPADLSEPYLGTDQAVILRRGLPDLRALGDLRSMITCALRGSDGARAIAASVLPVTRPILAPSDDRLLQLVQTGACDAAVVAAAGVGRLVAGRGGLLGPITARIEAGNGYAITVSRDSPVGVADVGRALKAMREDGTMHRLTRFWLELDPSRLRLLA